MGIATLRGILGLVLFVIASITMAYDDGYADKPFTPSKPFTPDSGHPRDAWGRPDNPPYGWPNNGYGNGRDKRDHHRHDGHDSDPAPHHNPHHRKPESDHDRHYHEYFSQQNKKHQYHSHETYYYHTHYLAPIKHHYYRYGHRSHVLPTGFITVELNGYPYYYFDGVFYINDGSGFVVVQAPVGAVIPFLPAGFITFPHGLSTFYYVNGTYFRWDNAIASYVVVNKPVDADESIKDETTGRLYVYPKQGQSEKQQSKDRYECHRWAVKETDIDPSTAEQDEIDEKDRQDYQRAISACLEGRGYNVK